MDVQHQHHRRQPRAVVDQFIANSNLHGRSLCACARAARYTSCWSVSYNTRRRQGFPPVYAFRRPAAATRGNSRRKLRAPRIAAAVFRKLICGNDKGDLQMKGPQLQRQSDSDSRFDMDEDSEFSPASPPRRLARAVHQQTGCAHARGCRACLDGPGRARSPSASGDCIDWRE
jgi:hypothetical protein